MHRLSHRLVAAERERQIGNAARYVHMRQRLADNARAFDECDAVAIMLLDPGRNREHIRIEDDILRREADLFGEELVGLGADLDFALERIGLPEFVERHHHDGGPIGAADSRLIEKGFLALLHRDGIDDRLSLNALQARFDDVELRRIHHDGNAGNVGLRRDEIEELDHGLLESRRPSSMLMSMICAPFATWSRATSRAA